MGEDESGFTQLILCMRILAIEDPGRQVLNRAVKPDRKRLTSDRAATRVLPLTDALRNAAIELTSAYGAFVWDELQNDELDVVFLRFETYDGVDRADDLIHQLASMN